MKQNNNERISRQELSQDPASLSLGCWFPPLPSTSTFEVARVSSLPSLTRHQSLEVASRDDRTGA